MADLYFAVVSDGGKNHSELRCLTAEVEVEAKNARNMEVRLKAHYEVDGEKKRSESRGPDFRQ